MKFTYHQKHLKLADGQIEYVEEKLLHLKKFKVLGDVSVMAKVDVEHFDSKVDGQNYDVKVHLAVPGATFHAEAKAESVEEAVDKVESKLRQQLEKHKDK